MSRYLVTGAAGFIGYHVSQALLERGDEVVGVDALTDYYDPTLKGARVQELWKTYGERFTFIPGDLADHFPTDEEMETIDGVVHLAAVAGVRASTDDPLHYVVQNVERTALLLDLVRRQSEGIPVVYASSSSVKRVCSIYGASKLACDALAEANSHLHGIRTTGLRYHTVYGPWGRPDMAIWKFTRQAFDGEPVDVYNYGNMARDFTFISDAVDATLRALDQGPEGHRVYDIGSGRSVPIRRVIETLAVATGRQVETRDLPMQLGDVTSSLAETGPAFDELGYRARVYTEEGIPLFVEWLRGWLDR